MVSTADGFAEAVDAYDKGRKLGFCVLDVALSVVPGAVALGAPAEAATKKSAAAAAKLALKKGASKQAGKRAATFSAL